MKGNKAHGRIGRFVVGNGDETQRTRWRSKALKLSFPAIAPRRSLATGITPDARHLSGPPLARFGVPRQRLAFSDGDGSTGAHFGESHSNLLQPPRFRPWSSRAKSLISVSSGSEEDAQATSTLWLRSRRIPVTWGSASADRSITDYRKGTSRHPKVRLGTLAAGHLRTAYRYENLNLACQAKAPHGYGRSCVSAHIHPVLRNK